MRRSLTFGLMAGIFGLGIAAVACDSNDGEHGSGATHGGGKVGGGVVATVDGRPILVSQVQALVDTGHLSPNAALARLEEQELLALEAKNRGYSASFDVDRVWEQSAVQKLLAELVERPTAALTIDPKVVDEAYEKQQKRFTHPEMRASMHVLVRVPKKAPKEMVDRLEGMMRGVIPELRSAKDLSALAEQLNGSFRDGFQLIAEVVPPLAHDAAADPTYLAAIFALPKPGVVDHPVHSVFGWHAVALTKIVPPTSDTREQADEVLRKELEAPERQKKLDQLLEDARKKFAVQKVDKAIEDLGKRELQFAQ